MSKTWKRILCLTLALASMATLFVGCGRKNKEVEEFTYPGQENMTLEEILEMDRKNPVTIKIYVADMTDVPDKNSPVLKAIAEATGTTVEIVSIASDRLQVLLATGEYPDVMVMNRNATFYDYIESGDVADIDELLKTWAPTVYQMNGELIDLFKNEKGELLYLTENNDLLREGEKHPEDATDPTRAQDELPWHSTVYVQYPLVKEIYGKAITTFDE
jgi:ABC-type glycerol-3-phosphate transport system substrate-binding protein